MQWQWLSKLIPLVALAVCLSSGTGTADSVLKQHHATKFFVILTSLVPYAPKENSIMTATARANQTISAAPLDLPISVRINTHGVSPDTYDVQVLNRNNIVISEMLMGLTRDETTSIFVGQRIQVYLKALYPK
jgi:hypothetical protein